MQVLRMKQRAPVVLLVNYYKAWTPSELEDSRRHTAHMVESLQ